MGACMSQKIDEPVPNECGTSTLEVNPVNALPSNVNQSSLDGDQEYVVSYMQKGNSDPTGYEPVQTISDTYQTGYEPLDNNLGNQTGQYDNQKVQMISGNAYQTSSEPARTISENHNVHYDNQPGDAPIFIASDNQNQQTLMKEHMPLAPVDAPATVPLSSNDKVETQVKDKGAEIEQNVSDGPGVMFEGRKFSKRVFDSNINGYVYITDDTPEPRGGLLM